MSLLMVQCASAFGWACDCASIPGSGQTHAVFAFTKISFRGGDIHFDGQSTFHGAKFEMSAYPEIWSASGGTPETSDPIDLTFTLEPAAKAALDAALHASMASSRRTDQTYHNLGDPSDIPDFTGQPVGYANKWDHEYDLYVDHGTFAGRWSSLETARARAADHVATHPVWGGARLYVIYPDRLVEMSLTGASRVLGEWEYQPVWRETDAESAHDWRVHHLDRRLQRTDGLDEWGPLTWLVHSGITHDLRSGEVYLTTEGPNEP